MSLDAIKALIANLDDADRRAVLSHLRTVGGVAVHPIESEWGTTAENILEAIHAAPDLTQRGVKGILGEAIFRASVVPQIPGNWQREAFEGDLPYDERLNDGQGSVTVQVKNQRKSLGKPMLDRKLSEQFGEPVYLVETQRTRNGQGQDEAGLAVNTRPYRFGEFDILAVCLHPSTGNWEDFVYCPGFRLLARPGNENLLRVMQPIIMDGGSGWTRNFNEAAAAARAHNANKRA